jgi:hypothetical protein
MYSNWPTNKYDRGNYTPGAFSCIGGGGGTDTSFYSTTRGHAAFIGAGATNNANGVYSNIIGGQSEQYGDYSVCVGGKSNQANFAYSAVSEGESNRADATSSAIGGGRLNVATGTLSVIGGGQPPVGTAAVS